MSGIGVFIQLFGCLCHFVGGGTWGKYLCIVDLKIKDDENFKERGTRGRRYLRNSSGRRGVIPGKTGNKVLLNSFQTPFKDLPEGL